MKYCEKCNKQFRILEKKYKFSGKIICRNCLKKILGEKIKLNKSDIFKGLSRSDILKGLQKLEENIKLTDEEFRKKLDNE